MSWGWMLWMVVMVGGVGVAWYLWTPLPPDVDQRDTVRTFGVVGKVIKPLGWLASFLPAYSGNMYQPIRAIMDLLIRPLPLDADPSMQVTDEIFDGVQVRMYRPKSAVEPLSVLMLFHGGGWSVGTYVSEDGTCRYLARTANVAVVSVEYRLAPEHPFPAALEDCVTATRHVLTHGTRLGLNPNRVGVYGLSAGGNLAATVSLRLLDPEFQSLPRLAYQVLVAPCLQGVDLRLPSYTDRSDVKEAILNQETMAGFYLSYAGLPISPANVQQVCRGQHIRAETRRQWAHYVHPDLLTTKSASSDRQPASEEASSGGTVNETLASLAEPVLTNYLLSPLLAPDHLLKRGPPALLVLSNYDVLRDDGLLYVRRLRHAGAEVTGHVIENGHHGSMLIQGESPGSAVTADMYERVVTFIADRTLNS